LFCPFFLYSFSFSLIFSLFYSFLQFFILFPSSSFLIPHSSVSFCFLSFAPCFPFLPFLFSSSLLYFFHCFSVHLTSHILHMTVPFFLFASLEAKHFRCNYSSLDQLTA
jgi:hypothetical protein